MRRVEAIIGSTMAAAPRDAPPRSGAPMRLPMTVKRPAKLAAFPMYEFRPAPEATVAAMAVGTPTALSAPEQESWN